MFSKFLCKFKKKSVKCHGLNSLGIARTYEFCDQWRILKSLHFNCFSVRRDIKKILCNPQILNIRNFSSAAITKEKLWISEKIKPQIFLNYLSKLPTTRNVIYFFKKINFNSLVAHWRQNEISTNTDPSKRTHSPTRPDLVCDIVWILISVSFSLTLSCVHECMLSHFSHVWFFETLWTVALHAPLSMRFSR